MSSVMASVAATVHPHQIETQDFDVYDLIVDARSAREYALDHLPGAVNLPVARSRTKSMNAPSGHAAESAAGTTRLASDVMDALEVREAGPVYDRPVSLERQLRLRRLVAHLQPGAFILVYCSNAGRDSEEWAALLEEMGFTVDVLAGGWPVYRRWVTQSLEELPKYLQLQGITAAPMGGLEAVVRELVLAGEQVLVLDWLSGEGSAPDFAWPTSHTVRQVRFETLLLDALRRLDAARIGWVAWCWPCGEGLRIPSAVSVALGRRPTLSVELSTTARASRWRSVLDSAVAELGGGNDGADALWSGLQRGIQALRLEARLVHDVQREMSNDPDGAARHLAQHMGPASKAASADAGAQVLNVALESLDEQAVKDVAAQCRALSAVSRLA